MAQRELRGQWREGGPKTTEFARKSQFLTAFDTNQSELSAVGLSREKDFVRVSKKSHAVSIRGVAYVGHLPYRKSVTFQILGGTEMRYKFLTAAFAATVALNVAGPAAATDLEVTHWWTSGGEAAAVAELAKAFDATGNHWVDGAIAG